MHTSGSNVTPCIANWRPVGGYPPLKVDQDQIKLAKKQKSRDLGFDSLSVQAGFSLGPERVVFKLRQLQLKEPGYTCTLAPSTVVHMCLHNLVYHSGQYTAPDTTATLVHSLVTQTSCSSQHRCRSCASLQRPCAPTWGCCSTALWHPVAARPRTSSSC